MTDKDIIDRLALVTGIGIVHVHEPRQSHYRRAWDWTVNRRTNVYAVCGELAPLLSVRRRQTIKPILAANGNELPRPSRLVPESPAAWAWVAGVIDGEGWIGPAPTARRRKPVVGVESTDRDVIDRLHELTGVGHVITVKRQRPQHHKPSWRWSVTSRSGTMRVLDSVLPQLGERRGRRSEYVLAQLTV